MYRIFIDEDQTTILSDDGKFIPPDPGNRDRIAYQEWLDDGNAPEQYAPYVSTETYGSVVQAHIDSVARAHGYNDGMTCVSYQGSANPTWAAEAQTFLAWRDAVWSYAYTQIAAVQSGQRPQPTVAGFVAELPAIEWPA